MLNRILRQRELQTLAGLLAAVLGGCAAAASGICADQPPAAVRRIEFDSSAAGDRVRIFFNRYFVPELNAIEGGTPRLFLDIVPAAEGSGIRTVPVNGPLIRTVRSFYDAAGKRLRIVFDLNPDLDFEVDQAYFQAENVFQLTVRKSQLGDPAQTDYDVQGVIGP